MKQLIHHANMMTMNETNEIIIDGYMLIEDGKISELGSGTPKKAVDKEYDMQGKWLLPGLINTHTHTPMTLFRGVGDDLPLKRWLEEKMWPLEGKLKQEDVVRATSLAMLEMLKSGTTTFLDMYHLFLDDIGELIVDSGMRGVLTRGMIGLCSKEEQQAKLQESVRIATTWRNAGHGRITTMLSPHAPYTCPPDFIRDVVEVAKVEQLPLHIHLAETKREVEEHLAEYGKRPVEHLDELGFFDQHALIAHAVWVTEGEVELLADKQVSVSHNPLSNLKLASGIAPVSFMIEQGVNVGLGTDSVASNNTFDLFQEMRTAALLQKGLTQNAETIPAEIALRMATVFGAKALGIDGIGSLEVGKQADFIAIDSSRPHLQPIQQMASHLVYAANGSDVSDVFVQGNQLVKDGQCLTLDEEKIIAEANECFSKLIHE